MNETNEPRCPECEDSAGSMPSLNRRSFIRVLGGGVAALAATAGGLPLARAAEEKVKEKAVKPAEALIQELHSTLTDEQKKTILLPFDHGAAKGTATRLGMYNGALQGQKIGQVYTKPQQELIEKIVRSMSSGDDGFKRLSRDGTWDNSGSLTNCGSHFFGEVGKDKQYAWLFTGHHLTIRADGDFMNGAAWGGPMYYGHSPNGYSDKNVFYFQTKTVLDLAKALDGKQMEKAVVTGNPGEQAGSIKFRKPEEAKPGISAKDLTKDQLALIETVMRNLLAPYRKEDADEVMNIVKANGGMEKMHLAFYRDKDGAENERWHFWRLEGPGFVWNYRVLPHVHCYVNIARS